MVNTSLTRLDWQILELLQGNGRITLSEIAKQLSRSRSTISEHMQKLDESGILAKITAKIDSEMLGFGLSALVRLTSSSSEHRQTVRAICEFSEVAECHVLAGSDLLMIRVIARDMAHLRDIVDQFTEYGATQTDVIFATVKNDFVVDQKLQSIAEGG